MSLFHRPSRSTTTLIRATVRVDNEEDFVELVDVQPSCACSDEIPDTRCDRCWFDDFFDSVGLEDDLGDLAAGTYLVTGHLVGSWAFTSEGYDYDEVFEVESVSPVPDTAVVASRA